MTRGLKRVGVALLLVLAAGTATSGATYTASSGNAQTLTAAADFGVHVSLDDPGSPLRGSVTLTADADETAGGSITQVALQRSPAGAGTWTTVCVDSGSPYSCSFDTTAVANGEYDLRARATNQNGYTRNSPVVTDRLIDNASPSVAIDPPNAWSRSSMPLTSTASDTGGSGLANVRYEYKPSLSGTWTTACTAASTPYSCSFDTTSLTDGASYDFRAVATDGAGNATTSAASTGRRIDNAAPSGILTAPALNLRATVLVAFTAADLHSGVASVTVQHAPTGTGNWSTACVATTAPFVSCSWDTTTATNGFHDVRVVVTDVAGNTFATTPVSGRRVDNTPPLTSLTDPNSPLSGTVTLNATASDTGGSGVGTVRIQRSPAGAGTWTEICADPTFAYSCSWTTTTLPDGLYDIRSEATDSAGNTGTSTVVASRRVDNYVPSAANVQTANGGATPGVLEAGDTMTLTYSEEIDPTSIIAGWDGTGSRSIYAAFTHHNQGDRVLFYSATSPYPVIPLAVSPGVNTGGNYVPNGGVTFNATLTRSGASFTVTIGTSTGGTPNATAPPAANMNWFPNSGAKDFLGKACTTTQRAETGASDVEF